MGYHSENEPKCHRQMHPRHSETLEDVLESLMKDISLVSYKIIFLSKQRSELKWASLKTVIFCQNDHVFFPPYFLPCNVPQAKTCWWFCVICHGEKTDTGTMGDGQHSYGLFTPAVTRHSTWSISYLGAKFREKLTLATWLLLHMLTL